MRSIQRLHARKSLRVCFLLSIFALTVSRTGAGVNTYTREGQQGGARDVPAHAAGAAAITPPWLAGAASQWMPLAHPVGQSIRDSAGDPSISTDDAPIARWIGPQQIIAADGFATLGIEVREDPARIGGVLFHFDHPVRIDAADYLEYFLMSPQSAGAGLDSTPTRYLLDVSLPDGTPVHASAVVDLFASGAQTARSVSVPGTRVLMVDAVAAAPSAPQFLWASSGKLGTRIDLHNTSLRRSAIVIYPQHFGLYPYFWRSREINGGVPQSVDLQAHLAKARDDIRALVPDPAYNGFVVLDFEPWFAGWEWTSEEIRNESLRLVREASPGVSDQEIERRAVAMFEHAAERFLLQSLRLCKELRPSARFGFYGYPWGEEVSPACARVLSQADALFPNAYMTLRGVPRSTDPGPGETYLDWSRSSITARVQNARAVAGDKPVMTMVWLQYHNTNPVYAGQPLRKDDLELMLRTPIDAGADGLIFWGHIDELDVLERQQTDLTRRVDPVLRDIARNARSAN